MAMSESTVVRELNRLKERVRHIEAGQRYAHGGSIENSSLEVRDDGGSLRAIVGQQADGTTGINVTNGPTPPVPSDPTVEPALAALTVTWDGQFADAQAAPLDWMRVEVHIGPDALFTPDQGTLRDTIESPQGGSVVVPLPYTEWHVKLRSRTTSGVASEPTAAVAGTPRQAESADITAGSIVAEHIAVDAITGKTITGGTVTGSVVQTGASGQRVVVTPDGPDVAADDGTSPAVVFYSGEPQEASPGILLARFSGAWALPYTVLSSPAIDYDPQGNPFDARLHLVAPQYGVTGGRIELKANNATGGTPQSVGNARLYGYTARDDTRESHLELECLSGYNAPGGNGTSLGPRSHLTMDGAAIRLRTVTTTADESLHVNSSGVQVDGILTAGNMAAGRVSITPAANTPTSMSVTGLDVKGSDHFGYATALSGVPGTTVQEVSVSGVSSTGITVWLYRTNTTTTSVYWQVIGAV